MKKLLFLLSFFVLLPLPTLAQEKIDSYSVKIEVSKEGTAIVEERIAYDFGEAQKHGIYRDIADVYNFGRQTNISILSVHDGVSLKYHFITERQGTNLQIKIGDADEFVTGKHIYVIKYKLDGVINFFKDHDELYWNAVGAEWEVPIKIVRTEVTIPKEINSAQVEQTCYQGNQDTNINCDNFVNTLNRLVFTSNNLLPEQGQTVVVSFPKGYFIEPTFWQKYFNEDLVKALIFLFIPLIIFVVLFFRWQKKGRDPKGKGTIITQFNAPDKLTPIEIGTLVDHTVQPRDLSAEIVELATKGYLGITRVEGEFLKKDDYILKRLKNGDDLLNEFDQKLLHALMSEAVNDEIKISNLKNKFYKDFSQIKNSVYNTLINKGYYNSNPSVVILKYSLIAFGFLYLGLKSFEFTWMATLSFIVSGVIIFLFGLIMPARTVKGVVVREHILGLKNYLMVAEKDRLEFHNAPEKNPETFEKFLPTAIALGVEKAWAKQFEGIYQTKPSWYNGGNQAFNSAIFVSSLSSFNSAISATTIKASRGGSGFGGGGVGGGFGGGGGGSW